MLIVVVLNKGVKVSLIEKVAPERKPEGGEGISIWILRRRVFHAKRISRAKTLRWVWEAE